MAIHTFGPGTLTLGETGSTQELSLICTAAAVEPSVESDDDVPVLSGDIIPGEERFTAVLTATVYLDLGSSAFAKWTWDNKGEVMPVEFIPNTASAQSIIGQVKIRPISIGGEANQKMTADVEFPFVEFPEMETVTP